jgi:hypothetical protein
MGTIHFFPELLPISNPLLIANPWLQYHHACCIWVEMIGFTLHPIFKRLQGPISWSEEEFVSYWHLDSFLRLYSKNQSKTLGNNSALRHLGKAGWGKITTLPLFEDDLNFGRLFRRGQRGTRGGIGCRQIRCIL